MAQHGFGATPRDSDRLARALLGAPALAAALLLALVVGFLALEAAPVFSAGHATGFFSNAGWYPLEQRFGMLPMLWATLAATAAALVLALPVGLAAAVYLVFLAPPRVAALLRAGLGLLAGLPSVVIGLWGLTVLVPLIARGQPPGTSLLAAAVVLALMVAPTVALTSASALGSVPLAWLQGAAALGLSHRSVVLGVALPAARSGIVAGGLLAAARALGETMAVLMVAGNVVQTPGSLLDPVRVLTANMALEMAYALGSHRAALFASGLGLALLVLALMALAQAVTLHAAFAQAPARRPAAARAAGAARGAHGGAAHAP